MTGWERYFVPCAQARNGKRSCYRRYPGKEIFYGVEAQWKDNRQPPPTLTAIRAYGCLHGERVWTGPTRTVFDAAKTDALVWARAWGVLDRLAEL